jgi:release factor glutamine methyltransferase
MNQSYDEILISSAAELVDYSSTPRLDAEILLALALSIDRTTLHANLDRKITSAEYDRFCVFLTRRKAFEPIAYIVGKKEFYGLDFLVNRSVLVPRPESELIIEKSLRFLENYNSDPLTVLDLGTGSGCLAVTLAVELKKRQRRVDILATDLSGDALDIAAENALRHGVTEDIAFLESSWFSALDQNEDLFDLIISNPPYISLKEQNLPRDLRHEPQEALFSGIDGLNDIEELISKASSFLKTGGLFLCEIGESQKREIMELFLQINPQLNTPYKAITFYKDFAGRDRIMALKV